MKVYKLYVQPHLEFAVPAWSPWTKADSEVLEKVQRRAVGMVTGLKSRDYEERLKELGDVQSQPEEGRDGPVRNVQNHDGKMSGGPWYLV